MLSLRGVTYRYPGVAANTLHGIDLDLAVGTITGLAGPVAAGKTTLCLVAGGLAPRVVGGHLVGEVDHRRQRCRGRGPCIGWPSMWSRACRTRPGNSR